MFLLDVLVRIGAEISVDPMPRHRPTVTNAAQSNLAKNILSAEKGGFGI
jgi:hypothetical protein